MAIKVKETKSGFGKVLLFAVLAVAAAAIVTACVVMADSKGVNLKESVVIEVAEGDGSSAVARKLHDGGAVKYPSVFKLQSKLGGYDGQYKPGTITVEDGMSYEQILEQLTEVNRDTVEVVIPEGYEAKQIEETLRQAGLPGAEGFAEALKPELYDYKFLENLPERSVGLEGYLFPATYEIPLSYSAQDIVNLMLNTFDVQFTEEYYDRAEEMKMSVDEIITMASIVERETNADSERAKVAGVFYNRINSGMKLQSCATVQYILGERKPVLSIADTQIDSPYNTYVYAGLPKGPISNPGIECIKAALYPEDTDAYYFCLSKSGEHIFSATYEEHVKAMESNDLLMNVDTSAVANEDSKK